MPSQKETSLPSTNFQGRAASLRGHTVFKLIVVEVFDATSKALGILYHLLRMVSWNLYKYLSEEVIVHPNHPVTR